MRYRVMLFALLLLIMASAPFLALPARQHALSRDTSSQDAPVRKEPAGPEFPPASSGVPGSPDAAASSRAPEAEPPVSKAGSMAEPVLLLDMATGQVLKMAQDAYVLGAVCSEMPPNFHPEALKAQAVAAHSYILRCKEQEQISPSPGLKGAYLQIDTGKRNGYVSEATARSMYGDRFDQYYPAVREAVRQVENQILVYNDQPIVAAYHAISAGKTEAASNVWVGSADYLVPVESPGDRLAPDYETTETFTAEEAESRLLTASPGLDLPEDPALWFSDMTRSESGYVTALRVGGTEISGQDLRNIFEQRSSGMDIVYEQGSFRFTATGYGHGVGMSQYGADYMARQGASYQEILAHYYQGSSLARLPQNAN